MHNFTGKHPHVIENVECRCKISARSILTSQKRQDVDAIMRSRQVEKHLQVQQKTSCRYLVLKKSICNCEYQGNADTSVVKKTSDMNFSEYGESDWKYSKARILR